MSSPTSLIEHQVIERDTIMTCRIGWPSFNLIDWDAGSAIQLRLMWNRFLVNPKKYQFAYSHFVNESTFNESNGTTTLRYKSTIIDYRKTEHPSYMSMWNDIDRNQWKINKFFKFRKNLQFICVNDKIDHSAEGQLHLCFESLRVHQLFS